MPEGDDRQVGRARRLDDAVVCGFVHQHSLGLVCERGHHNVIGHVTAAEIEGLLDAEKRGRPLLNFQHRRVGAKSRPRGGRVHTEASQRNAPRLDDFRVCRQPQVARPAKIEVGFAINNDVRTGRTMHQRKRGHADDIKDSFFPFNKKRDKTSCPGKGSPLTFHSLMSYGSHTCNSDVQRC
jgi:hypothetical protein